jgi:hypothetical protein
MNLHHFRENLESYKRNFVSIQQSLSTLSSYVLYLAGQHNGKAFDRHLRNSSNQTVHMFLLDIQTWVKLSLHYAMKTYGEVDLHIYIFLT